MGLNAYFTYTVVKGMGVPWQAALGAVFLSGVAFLLLTLLGVRQLIVSAIPHELYAAVAAGVGLFIALHRISQFRHHRAPSRPPRSRSATCAIQSTALALFGLLLIAALLAWRVRAAMLIGILATTARRACSPASPMDAAVLQPGRSRRHRRQARYRRRRCSIGFVEIIFVFLFIDLFDNIGTLVAVGKKASLFDEARQIPRVNRILFSDAIATIVGSLTGTSTVVSYIESAAGVAAGGRTGVTAIVTGLLFVAGAVRRAGGGRDPRRRHRARADHRGQPDGVGGERDRVERSRSRHPGVSDHDDDPADVQHRQRPGVRIHRVHAD